MTYHKINEVIEMFVICLLYSDVACIEKNDTGGGMHFQHAQLHPALPNN
jgi:hypothetical protein